MMGIIFGGIMNKLINEMRNFFLIVACCSLAACAMQAPIQTILPPDALPAHLAAQPQPIWHAPLSAHEVEQASFVATDRLLISTLEYAGMGNIFDPKSKELVMFETVQGKPLWSLPVSSQLYQMTNSFGMSGKTLFTGIADEEKLRTIVAVDTETGKTVWQRKDPSSSWYELKPARKLAISGLVKGADLQLSGIDLESGKDLWSAQLAGVATDGATRAIILSFNDGFLVIGKKLAYFGYTDGKPRWTVAAPGKMNVQGLSQLETGDTLLLSSKTEFQALDARDGHVRWRVTPADGEFVTPTMNAGALVMLERSKEGHKLRQLDMATGATRWISPTEAALRSPILLFQNSLYYTTKEHLIALDLASGKVRLRASLPESLHSPSGLPDHLLVSGENIIVAREVGVAAFQRERGKLIFAESVKGARPFTHEFLSYKSLLRQSGAGRPSSSLAAIAPGVTQASTQFARQSSDIYLRMSQVQLDTVRMQTRQVLESPRSTGTERMTALSNQEAAIRTDQAIQTAQAQAQLAAATAALAQSMVGLAQAYRDSWVSTSFKLNDLQANWAMNTHSQSIQQSYYVRPFYNEGWGVTLVNLNDGQRADLYVSPPNEPLQINAANLPMFVIDPVQNRLYAKGLGINLPDVPSYNKVAWPAITKGLFGLPDNFTISYPSVLAYDLTQVIFRKEPRANEPDPWVPLAELEVQLRQAILSGDEAGVQKLLASGANPNTVDQYGYNALIYAAVVDQKPIVKLLLDKGADAGLRDDHGWLAMHYSFMTVPMPSSTGLLWDAAKEQIKKTSTTEAK